ncbi:MAG: hypothetical protein ACRDL7_07395, partial [Gaiellaceae bacterium]
VEQASSSAKKLRRISGKEETCSAPQEKEETKHKGSSSPLTANIMPGFQVDQDCDSPMFNGNLRDFKFEKKANNVQEQAIAAIAHVDWGKHLFGCTVL